jgi:hypothetical protein
MRAKADPEDPAAKAARIAEQTRADAAFVDNSQDLLGEEMRRRVRRFGARVALQGGYPGGYRPGGYGFSLKDVVATIAGGGGGSTPAPGGGGGGGYSGGGGGGLNRF